jgi:two-component system, NarL family, response regulator
MALKKGRLARHGAFSYIRREKMSEIMPNHPSPIRLLIADDHAIVRVGLASMLANEGDITIVAEAETGVQAVALYRKHLPQVALFDVRMPKLDGLEALAQVMAEFPDACVLMLSTAELDEEVARAMAAGARGYIAKTSSPARVAAAVRGAAAGKTQFSQELTARLGERQQLSPREAEVLAGMARGFTNKHIASDLFISEHTVKTYVKGILAKFSVEDRAGAVAEGFKRGILRI